MSRLYGKFHVRKDGEMGPIVNCFVLRYDRDPHALVALAAYAESVRSENQGLSDDLRRVVSEFGGNKP